MSLSLHIDDNKKYILILGKGPTQGLEQHWLKKKFIQLILLKIIKRSVWACIIMEKIVIYLLKVQKLLNSNLISSKDSEIVATPLCLGNISEDFSVHNMKKTGLNGYVYDFSVDYDAIAVDDI